jgi:hypothetical protein
MKDEQIFVQHVAKLLAQDISRYEILADKLLKENSLTLSVNGLEIEFNLADGFIDYSVPATRTTEAIRHRSVLGHTKAEAIDSIVWNLANAEAHSLG